MGLRKEVELLREELKEVKEENKCLKETIKALIQEIEELKGIVKEKSKPDFVKEEIKEEPKQPGQKEGHEGYSRRIPKRIDEVKEHKLDRCPNCGGVVSDTQEIRERTIEDIEQPRTKNTKHLIHRCYCGNCDKIVEPVIYDALPNSRFGLRLMILILILKLDCRIPSKKITSVLDSVFGVKISDGEIYNILNQLSEAFGDYYLELEEKIKYALAKHIDETSWRINGKNNWLWIFINKEAALFAVRKRRSSKVPIEILGNQEGKFVTSDRFSAYDELAKKSKCKQQICWVHIIRNAKDLKEKNKEGKYVYKRLKYIYNKAKKGRVSKKKLLHWIDLMTQREYKSWNVYKFIKSICVKHREDLFRFVNNPEIEPTNNLAERGLRHAVVIRKISNGSRSEDGAETTARLLSVLQTVKLQTNNPYEGILNLLQNPE
jgi:transposase-like protein/transposase